MARHVLVTGGTNGIGFAIARRFHDQGDVVGVIGRDTARLKRATEAGLTALVADLSAPSDVETLTRQLGPSVDVLVNCAGGNGSHDEPDGSGLARTANAWEMVLRQNLLSAVLMTAAVEERLRPGGTVINIGSIGAEYGAGPYGAAKAALASWNVDLAARLGPRGVTANVISPGYVEGTDFFHGGISPERRARLIDATATKRPGAPDDVASLATFLASDGARHITGQTLHVNGGAHSTR